MSGSAAPVAAMVSCSRRAVSAHAAEDQGAVSVLQVECFSSIHLFEGRTLLTEHRTLCWWEKRLTIVSISPASPYGSMVDFPMAGSWALFQPTITLTT